MFKRIKRRLFRRSGPQYLYIGYCAGRPYIIIDDGHKV